MTDNPYQAPLVEALEPVRESPTEDVSAAEEIRRRLIKHEASIKSIGLLYFLGGIFGVGAGLLGCGLAITSLTESEFALGLMELAIILLAFGIGVLQLWTAIGLRKLRPSSRVGVGVVSGMGLLHFPIGTLINGYFLYLVFSSKGSQIFSPEYKKVIEATPHIKYKTSIILWILLGVLILLLLFAVAGAWSSG